MSDPRGAAGGSTTELGTALPHPTTPTTEPAETPAGAGARSAEPTTEPPPEPATERTPTTGSTADTTPALDAGAHAHVLDDPLPPVDDGDETDPPLFAATRSGPAPVAAAPEAAPPGTSRHTLVAVRPPLRRRRGFRVAVGTTVGLVLVASAGLATYLYLSATAWRDQADGYLAESLDLGEELSRTRGDLAGAQAELEAVREQLATAHQRITELASEKAQINDDFEITQQLVDYQKRISDAAGDVALALDQCVQSQQELIGYLARAAEEAQPGNTASPPPYDPAQLAQFESDVEAFCQEASEANISLQQELAR